MWNSWSCTDYQETPLQASSPLHFPMINDEDSDIWSPLCWWCWRNSTKLTAIRKIWVLGGFRRRLDLCRLFLTSIEMMQVVQSWSLSYPDNKRWKLFAKLQTGQLVLSPRQEVNPGWGRWAKMQITVWSLCVSVASAQQPLLGRQKNSRDFGFQFSVKFRIWNELKYGSFPVYSVSKSTLICLSAS